MQEVYRFAAFWAGERLSPFELACLESFSLRNYDTVLYSYNNIGHLPAGVVLRDAREILSADFLDKFRYDGRPNMSHFSDLFRYELFSKTSQIWIDTDVLLFRNIDIELGASVLTREHQGTICGAIMRIDSNDPRLALCVEKTKALSEVDLTWGQTGPTLLSNVFSRSELESRSHRPELFYPISHDAFWKTFLPEYADECEQACAEAFTIHLWNNIVDRMGVWKDMAPPVGSFLYRRFKADGTLSYFKDTYPVGVIRQMAENWILRQSGGAVGILGLSRQILPSIMRTARHHGWLKR